jgi:hypothetical protein
VVRRHRGVGIPHMELKVSGNLDAARKINVDTHRSTAMAFGFAFKLES